jgi:hypothetical protein
MRQAEMGLGRHRRGRAAIYADRPLIVSDWLCGPHGTTRTGPADPSSASEYTN